MNYKAQATLHRGRDHKSTQSDTLENLVRHVMTNVRPSERKTYSIMVGETIYDASRIEDFYNGPDFPKA